MTDSDIQWGTAMHPAAKKCLWWGIGLLVVGIAGTYLINVAMNLWFSSLFGFGGAWEVTFTALNLLTYTVLPTVGAALIAGAVVINVLAPRLDSAIDARRTEQRDPSAEPAAIATDSAESYDAAHIARSATVNPYAPPEQR